MIRTRTGLPVFALLIALLALLMAGCSGGGTTESATSEGAMTETEATEAQATSGEEAFEPYVRIDGDDPDAYDVEGDDSELRNLRIITAGMYEFHEPKDKYGIPADYEPDETGLDTLDVSASAQFCGWQFEKLADELRDVAHGKEICVLDLRRESHALLNDRPFSVYALHNWSNLGLSADEIMAEEERFFGSLVGGTIEAYPKEDEGPGEAYAYDIETFLPERELVEGAGMRYLRIPIQDHRFPSPEYVDQFIDLVRAEGPDGLWMHVHCHTGKGRTGAFLVMYDKMRNPDIAIEEIAIRQCMLGSTYMLYTKDADDWKAPLYEEKARMTRLFGEYVEEMCETNYEVPWSEWLRRHEAEQDVQEDTQEELDEDA